ncbi:uncharacterized protein MELLADRAFT_73520 [Melampsora larici-populina 98AG31]|uniref:Uncharacterized protein n=1 Tax=Melampsora larici-populina (strain 98AG31 / pathotype 3-4-7) TaxID=747676 RepID=F4S997_MELLP|nr:uncharacterized protein MELLADRAFT_73520 [Melampsora larici-populina 98AG31]EGF98782.1 hypothetical protein MELLADRAFT_73520 [Melampsora larici-populina 98AG31]
MPEEKRREIRLLSRYTGKKAVDLPMLTHPPKLQRRTSREHSLLGIGESLMGSFQSLVETILQH